MTTTIFALILEAALRWGPAVGVQIANIWKKTGSLTAEEAVAELTALLVEINAKTVEGAIAEAEAIAGIGANLIPTSIPVTGTVTGTVALKPD